MSRAGFDQALAESCLSHFDPGTYQDVAAWERRKRTSSVRVQWDPERDLHLKRLSWRTIQIGLGGVAVHRYISDWIVTITDVTATAHSLCELIIRGDEVAARRIIPSEDAYPLTPAAAWAIGATNDAHQSPMSMD